MDKILDLCDKYHTDLQNKSHPQKKKLLENFTFLRIQIEVGTTLAEVFHFQLLNDGFSSDKKEIL